MQSRIEKGSEGDQGRVTEKLLEEVKKARNPGLDPNQEVGLKVGRCHFKGDCPGGALTADLR